MSKTRLKRASIKSLYMPSETESGEKKVNLKIDPPRYIELYFPEMETPKLRNDETQRYPFRYLEESKERNRFLARVGDKKEVVFLSL